MKNKTTIIGIVLAVLLVITGVFVFKAVSKNSVTPVVVQPTDTPEVLPTVDPSVIVNAALSKAAVNTVTITATGLKGTMVSIGYELTYESQGLIKGVDSGSSSIDVTGKDVFTRDIYLGTCSRNVCKPDPGVTKVSVVLKFTQKDGKKSQFSKDFTLGQSSASGSSTGSATVTPPSE
jgi:hypothetical protein